MRIILAVALGGAIGSSARYLLAGYVQRALGSDYPWGILAVNVIGCSVMGALTEAMALKWSLGPEMRAFLAVGILGGFTTFSSFALDTATLASRGSLTATLGYVIGSVVLSIAGFYVALYLVRQALS
jgi:fluoride exporter